MKLIALVVLTTALVFGQEAKIMIVERADSAKLAAAYKSYQDAKKQWEEIKTDVAKHYTMEGKKVMDGWEKVQFSADFRALVPDSSPYASRGYYYPNCWGSVITTNAGGANLSNSTATFPLANQEDRTVTVDSDLLVKEPKQ